MNKAAQESLDGAPIILTKAKVEQAQSFEFYQDELVYNDEKDLVICIPCVSAVPQNALHSHWETHHSTKGNADAGTCYTCCKPIDLTNNSAATMHFSGNGHLKKKERQIKFQYCTLCKGIFPRTTKHANGAHDSHVKSFNADDELMQAMESQNALRDAKEYGKQTKHCMKESTEAKNGVKALAFALGGRCDKPSRAICMDHLTQITGWDGKGYAGADLFAATGDAKCGVCHGSGCVSPSGLVLLRPINAAGLDRQYSHTAHIGTEMTEPQEERTKKVQVAKPEKPEPETADAPASKPKAKPLF